METLSLEEIQQEMEFGEMTPSRAADLVVVVASKYGRAADEYLKASASFAREFTKERENFKSDTACERALENSDLGINEKYWKYQLKKAEQMTKALNTLVYVRTAEAKNQV